MIAVLNEVLGAGIDEEHQLVFAFATAEKLVADPLLKDQALNNSREQFKNAGDIIAMTQEKLVETKTELAEKNDIQNAAIAEAMSRLFGNQEGLAKLGEVMANYVYDHHHLPRA